MVTIDANPWFVAADVCKCLGMSVLSGTHKWLGGLSDTEKRLVTIHTDPQIFRGTMARSGTLISESGLYKLALRSTKPEARQFQDWVTGTVLPSLHGTF